MDSKAKDAQLRNTINQKLIETGQKDRLKGMLRQQLVECGWRDEMKNYCREVIKQKGLENVTVEDLVNEITPKGRAQVPEKVKADLLVHIRRYLTQCASAGANASRPGQ
eukprot:TRINITY_DN15130_c0_g1_i1.p1 TRINITY_DN15130_c0_g1~~TRINITY_DN15130_c0_g1_i1.p1  ORF type:complete len:109 (-),score=25.26 TRINITY_DN15130_c0_g1_i1:105-431(-)